MALDILPENVLDQVSAFAVFLLRQVIEGFQERRAETHGHWGFGSPAFGDFGALDFMNLRFRKLLDHLLASLLYCGCHFGDYPFRNARFSASSIS